MKLVPTSYECVSNGYVYKFGFVPVRDKKWVVCRQKEEEYNIGFPYEVLQYVDNQLKWVNPGLNMMWMYDERTASYENEHFAAADVEALLSGTAPAICVRNKNNSPSSQNFNDDFTGDYGDDDENDDDDDDEDEENEEENDDFTGDYGDDDENDDDDDDEDEDEDEDDAGPDWFR